MPACLTVDVEDWYDGMAELGHGHRPAVMGPSGLEAFSTLVTETPDHDLSRLTLFVVGKDAHSVRDALRRLSATGHELVFRWKGFPRGGSYQRLLPRPSLTPLLRSGDSRPSSTTTPTTSA